MARGNAGPPAKTQLTASYGEVAMPYIARTPTFAFVLTLALTLAADAADWPQWRGPDRDNVWPENGTVETFPPAGLKGRWSAPVGFGWSSPVIAQSRVYVTDSELAKPKARERIHCFDATTGKPLWT